jgi:hypothetical protein
MSKRLESMMLASLSDAELRAEQRILLKNISKSTMHGYEWIFSTSRLDKVNRELARR